MPAPDRLLDEVIEWDIANWSRALGFWENHTSQSWADMKALEIGSRHGGLSLAMALRGAQVVCTDVAGPTGEACRKHAHYQVVEHISYAHVDALKIPFVDCFDVVLFKSVLGGIGRANQPEKQARAVSQMFRALKPGGELWFAENLLGSPMHQFLRKRQVRWGADWRYVTVKEIEEFFSPFSSFTYKTLGFWGVLGRNPWQQRFMGLGDRMGIERLVPYHWRYLIVGLARK